MVGALSAVPSRVQKLQLQANVIGESGASAIADAIASSKFEPRHLNILENRFDKGGAAADALRKSLQGKYMDVKLEPKPSAETVMASVAELMRREPPAPISIS